MKDHKCQIMFRLLILSLAVILLGGFVPSAGVAEHDGRFIQGCEE